MAYLKNWSYRLGNLEARTCNENLLQGEPLTTVEIIVWEETLETGKSCYVAACFRNGDLSFIRDRPFSLDHDTFMEVAEQGHRYLRHQKGECCQ